MKKRIFSFLALVLPTIALAQNDAVVSDQTSSVESAEHSSFFAGHNLTPTTDVLAAHEATLGSYVVGYGVTDRLTIATSPFIIGFYNMAMGDLRYQLVKAGDFRFTAEGMYFKSLDYSNLGPHQQYQQKSGFLRLTASEKFSPFYTLHLSTGHQYFWDATAPYSLDPVPNQGPYVLSVSSLHELHFTQNFGMFLELGVLGLNYLGESSSKIYASVAGPGLHLGASLFYQTDRFYLQLGLSETRIPYETNFATQAGSGSENLSASSIQVSDTDTIIHPELQLQFYL